MIKYVGTNILARLMANDSPALSERAISLVMQHAAHELLILDAVLVELFFVLEHSSLYQFNHRLIAELFEKIILPTPQFVVSNPAQAALALYKEKPQLDFMDCLLAVSAEMSNRRLITFDKDLQKLLRPAT